MVGYHGLYSRCYSQTPTGGEWQLYPSEYREALPDVPLSYRWDYQIDC